MQLDDDGRAPGDLEDDEAAMLRAMGEVKAKGGAMFAAAQQMNNPDGLEFTGDAVRAVATRVATRVAAVNAVSSSRSRKSAYLNLALPLVQLAEPAAPKRHFLAAGTLGGGGSAQILTESFTEWDVWTVHQGPDVTLRQLLDAVGAKCGKGVAVAALYRDASDSSGGGGGSDGGQEVVYHGASALKGLNAWKLERRLRDLLDLPGVAAHQHPRRPGEPRTNTPAVSFNTPAGCGVDAANPTAASSAAAAASHGGAEETVGGCMRCPPARWCRGAWPETCARSRSKWRRGWRRAVAAAAGCSAARVRRAPTSPSACPCTSQDSGTAPSGSPGRAPPPSDPSSDQFQKQRRRRGRRRRRARVRTLPGDAAVSSDSEASTGSEDSLGDGGSDEGGGDGVLPAAVRARGGVARPAAARAAQLAPLRGGGGARLRGGFWLTLRVAVPAAAAASEAAKEVLAGGGRDASRRAARLRRRPAASAAARVRASGVLAGQRRGAPSPSPVGRRFERFERRQLFRLLGAVARLAATRAGAKCGKSRP
jgi:hypothetical protein